MEDLIDRLRRGKVDLAALVIESLERGLKKPNGHDNLPLTASAILGELADHGMDLASLPPTYEDLTHYVDVGWYERESHDLPYYRRQLTVAESWDEATAETEAAAYYTRSIKIYDNQVALYGLTLARAARLLETVLAMDLSLAGSPSIATASRLFGIKAALLEQAENAVNQLVKVRIGDKPVRMTGAEYRRHVIVEFEREIEKTHGPQVGMVREAFELLQALAQILYPSTNPA